MTYNDFRIGMEASRRAVDDEAREYKDPMHAMFRMRDFYESLDPGERAMASRVLEEWALSDDEHVRRHALALIDHFAVAQTAPVLEKLAAHLAVSKIPGAPYELMQVNRTLASLLALHRF